jgi:feruloyl-CoA synthase
VDHVEMQVQTGHHTPPPAGVPYRPVAVHDAPVRCETDGAVWHVRNTEPLADHPQRMTDCLVAGAQRHPERVLAARRGPDGVWIKLTYREMLERARAIGQALLDRGVSAERPLAILSGNDLEHLQLALGAMWAGVPYAPVSPPYALVSTDFGKLRHVFDVLTPGLVYAADGGAFDKAIDAHRGHHARWCAAGPYGHRLRYAAADTRDHGRRRTGRRRARHAGEDPLHLGLHA